LDLLGHGRQGINVARWIEKKLKDRNHVVFFIDPLELDLPLLDSMYKEITNPSERIIDLRNKINEAEGTFQLLLSITTVHLVH
jgi:NAD(P)H-dependent FMN reductase